MTTRHRCVLVLAAAAALGGALISAGPAQAAAPPAPSTVAGYYADHATYTSVTATWVQPKTTCTSPTAYVSFWVGLDGIISNQVEQIGTQVVCTAGVPAYSAWYEVYPAPPVIISKPVKPGDTLTASVVYTATNKFTLTITNATEGWTATFVKSLSAPRSSAEIFVQGPGTGGSLANFNKVNFTNCLINNAPLASAGPTGVDMVSSTGVLQAHTSALTTPTSFNVTWVHA